MQFIVVQHLGNDPCFLSAWRPHETNAACWSPRRENALKLDQLSAHKIIRRLALFHTPCTLEKVVT